MLYSFDFFYNKFIINNELESDKSTQKYILKKNLAWVYLFKLVEYIKSIQIQHVIINYYEFTSKITLSKLIS